MIVPNKQNINFYRAILRDCNDRKEIFKYIFRRLIGIKKPFDKEIIIAYDGMKFNCGDQMENCKTVCASFETEAEKELEVSDGIVIDIGAHIGKHSIPMAKKLAGKGRVIAIEGSPINFKLLEKNIKLNKLKNLKAFNNLLFDEEKYIDFHVPKFHPARSSIYNEVGEDTIQLKTTRLDDLLKDLRGVKLMKIDVECAEPNVIRGGIGLITRNKPRIVFEAMNEERFGEVFKLLSPLGYSFRQIDPFNHVAEIK